MRIDTTSISCGVRRLFIDDNEKPSKEQLSGLIKDNKNQCAIVMTGIPARRRDVIKTLLDNGFQRVDNPTDIDDSVKSEMFIGATVNADLTDMAALIMHHGNDFIDNLNFFFMCYK